MTLRLALRHRTTYRFEPAVRLAPHVVRLRPAPHATATVTDHDLRVPSTDGAQVRWHLDPERTWQGQLTVPGRVAELVLDASAVVEPTVPSGATASSPDPAPAHRRRTADGTHLGTLVDQAAQLVGPTPSDLDSLVATTELVAGAVEHRIDLGPRVADPDATIATGAGSCRDSAWVLVQVLRRLGVPARFTTGWLIDLGPVAGQDRLELHAWAEAHRPGLGWVGLDATSGAPAGRGHVPLASAATPDATAPVTGYTERCAVTLDVDRRVERLDGPPAGPEDQPR